MSRIPLPALLLAVAGTLLCGGARPALASATDDLTAATGAGQTDVPGGDRRARPGAPRR